MNDLQPLNLKQYTRRCFLVLFAVLCGTAVMVGASFMPLENHLLKIALILAIAAANAGVVATFLMHIVTEKRFILIVLAFTVVFFIALMGLSSWAQHDHPSLPRAAAH